MPRESHPARLSTQDSALSTLLERDLRREFRGEIRFDAGSRALYATDASNYRMVPIGVAIPRDTADIVAAVRVARRYGAPVLTRGAGTSLAGQCCNWALVLDCSKYVNKIVTLDPALRRARVEPGLVLDNLRSAAEEHHLTFGPDPATHKWCTLGGMIGNNSCGVHSIMSGRTSDNILSLKILTYDGVVMTVGPTSDNEYEQIVAEGGRRAEIYRALRSLRDRYAHVIRTGFPTLPRRVSGFNLDELLPENGFNVARALVGTEGTCVTILEAETKLIHSPPERVLLLAAFADIYHAADAIPEIMSFGPIGLEGFDDDFMREVRRKKLHLEDVALFPEGGGWFLIEFGGATTEEADAKAAACESYLTSLANPPLQKRILDKSLQRRIWRVRESGLPATSSTGDETENHEGWEDAAVPPEKLGGYLREFRALINKYEYRSALYGHFGHGCLHTRLTFDLRSDAGLKKWRAFLGEAAHLVVRFGGSLSGEHGDGQARAELLPIMYGHELMQAFREFKAIWDPLNKMNPGKVIDPYRVDEHLRYSTDYKPWEPLTVFNFPNDRNSFTQATERCVGAGLCRRADGGTMCPSFMATGEEEHSTRGRARMLSELMRGETIAPDWRNDDVKEALDLCLACKGCKGDCPVEVDIATYKAEFLSHYYKRRVRPRAAYAMGLIHRWAPIGSKLGGLVNAISANAALSPVMKWLGGIHPHRNIPRFAARTFRNRFERRATDTPAVLLWTDTFTNYFTPEIAHAAVRVLEHCGVSVAITKESLCCGRPLYDWGMLDRAKSLLERTMEVTSRTEYRELPIIVLEPSCASVFRDELMNLYPNDPRAKSLSQRTMLLSEYLAKHVGPSKLPRLSGSAMLHGHCHHKAIATMNDEFYVLTQCGLDIEILDTGCCGMAGAFGFDQHHYDLSVEIANLTLLPALSKSDAPIITDGFSCREQIGQLAQRRAKHLAEMLAEGLPH